MLNRLVRRKKAFHFVATFVKFCVIFPKKLSVFPRRIYTIKCKYQKQNGKLLVGSRDIAIGLEKEHKDVLRKIEDVLTVGEFSERGFTKTNGINMKKILR